MKTCTVKLFEHETPEQKNMRLDSVPQVDVLEFWQRLEFWNAWNKPNVSPLYAFLGLELDCLHTVVRPDVIPETQRHAHVCTTTVKHTGWQDKMHASIPP